MGAVFHMRSGAGYAALLQQKDGKLIYFQLSQNVWKQNDKEQARIQWEAGEEGIEPQLDECFMS